MSEAALLSPRYYLDDTDWLEGVDPSRQYWINVNGDNRLAVRIAGLIVNDIAGIREAINRFRELQPSESMRIERIAATLTIHRIGVNHYAIEAEIDSNPVWHLFDRESLESLLMTAHPDWLPSKKDIELGRKQLMLSLGQPLYLN